MASGWRRCALHRTTLVAVVGSLGKSTAVRCIAAALDQPEPRLPFNQFGLLALNLLAIPPGRERAVLEVGIGKPGEMAAYAQMLRPDIVVVTSIASDHIKQMNNLETTAREKAAMLHELQPGGIAVLNGDDPRVLAMKAMAAHTITFGFACDHQVRCVESRLEWPHGTRLTVSVDGETVTLRSRLLGRVMVYPMLAALAVAKAAGIDVQAAARRLEKVTALDGRLHALPLAMGAEILRDDHKASAESFVSAFALLTQIPARRHLVVLGDIFEPWGDVDSLYRELAFRLAKTCDGAYLVGEEAQRWLPGLLAGGVARDPIVCNLTSLGNAVMRLQQALRPGDVVLVKGRQEEHLERISLALAGRPVPCTLRTCEAVNLSCDQCGGRGASAHGSSEPADEFTPKTLDTIERSLWRQYNDRVVGDFLIPRLGSSQSLVLKTDVFEEALGSRSYPQALLPSMVGMDLSQTILRKARQRVPELPLARADARRLPFASAAFASVVSTSTLDHFCDPCDLQRSLREIARVLRPGGRLLLILDNPWHPLVALRNAVPHRLRMRLKVTPYFVGYTYDPRQVVRVLEDVGFEVRENQAILHFPRTLVRLWGSFSRRTSLDHLDKTVLRWLGQAELLASWPSRWCTGQYIAVCAERKSSDPVMRVQS